MSDLFVVASGSYEQYQTWAAFTTREKAEAWAAARNAQAVVNAGTRGLSCETKEDAGKSYWVEDNGGNLPLDPTPEPLETAEQQLDRHYGDRGGYAAVVAQWEHEKAERLAKNSK